MESEWTVIMPACHLRPVLNTANTYDFANDKLIKVTVVAMELKYLSVVEQVFLSPVKISSFMLSQLNNVNFHQ
eukprot:m.235057 g.235057  ORF g.235057 m.235057 type:complete len:73 (-) comp16039_c0_seq4:4003-4221(-)